MEPNEDSTLEDFQGSHAVHLKEYLARRGLNRTSKKSELAALAYSCHVMRKPQTQELVSNIKETLDDYQHILHLPDGIIMPDLFKVLKGWISETDGRMKYWPPLTIVDIVDYFRENHTNTDKLLSDYKAGKAYDYFKTDWLKEIHYHSMGQLSTSFPGFEKYCLLRTQCTPSQHINDPQHNV